MPTLRIMWKWICCLLAISQFVLSVIIVVRGQQSIQEIILCVLVQLLLFLCFFIVSTSECYLRPRLSVLLILLTYTTIGVFLTLSNDLYLGMSMAILAFLLCYLVLVDYTPDRYYQLIPQTEIDY